MLGSLHRITAAQHCSDGLFSKLYRLHKRRASSRAQSGQRCSALLHRTSAWQCPRMTSSSSRDVVQCSGTGTVCAMSGESRRCVCPIAPVHILVLYVRGGDAIGHWSFMTCLDVFASVLVNYGRHFCLEEKETHFNKFILLGDKITTNKLDLLSESTA